MHCIVEEPDLQPLANRHKKRNRDDIYMEGDYQPSPKRRLTETMEREMASLRISGPENQSTATMQIYDLSRTKRRHLSDSSSEEEQSWGGAPSSGWDAMVLLDEQEGEALSEDFNGESRVTVVEPVRKLLKLSAMLDDPVKSLLARELESTSKALVLYRDPTKNPMLDALRVVILSDSMQFEDTHPKTGPIIEDLDDNDIVLEYTTQEQSEARENRPQNGFPFFAAESDGFLLRGWSPQENPQLLQFWWPSGCGVQGGFSPVMVSWPRETQTREVDMDLGDS